LFEHCLFTHLQRYPNIKVRRQHHVLEITGSPDGSRVTGVRYATAAGNAALSADIVVDASGHGSFTTGFLQAGGRPLPVEEVVGVDIRYSSTMFAAPEPLTNYKGLISFPKAPEHVRYGYLLPAENNCWQVLMVGRGDDVPPVEGNAFQDFARQLETPSIYNAIRDAERVSDIARYGFPESSWKHFGQLGSFPEGLLPFGDAICRFNPIWGQGMTVALQEGQLLRHLLQGAHLGGQPLAALSQIFVERAEVLIADPWTMATLPDFVYPATRGERPRDLKDRLRFQRVLHHLAVSDPDIHKLMFEVRHLLKPSAALRQPEIMRLVEPELARA
jgi:2-polyprenyl-6-methoxyphenol hydroxylase-like FAD-dependent oxidoreductase